MSSYSSIGGAGSATVRKQLIFLQLSTREAQHTASVPRRVLDPLRKNPLYNPAKDARVIPMSQILKKKQSGYDDHGENNEVNILDTSNQNNNNTTNNSNREPAFL